METQFEASTVLTFAVKKELLEDMIPECLELDVFQDQWAFLAIAMVDATGLRPKGFPRFMGNDFFLIGYRVFVKYRSESGKRLRGLYILKSETNKPKMEWMGNVFTHYNYTTTDITQSQDGAIQSIRSVKSNFSLAFSEVEGAGLPQGSPFDTWKEARRFAGPLPFTFTYLASKKKILIIEGVRQNWMPTPLQVIDYQFSFLGELNLDAVLANAFVIKNIPYYWKKGRVEIWNG